MKNVHLIPTDKPSRLFYDISMDKLVLASTSEVSKWFENKNIYITSDEEIKEGDWCYQVEINDGKVDKCYDVTLYHTWTNNGVDKTRKFKKIILTTDQDLIKDGVQVIDDEFLEWFVNNPSCEEVEVVEDIKYFNIDELRERHIKRLPHLYSEKIAYKIIIPKPKQETLEETAEIFVKNRFAKQICNDESYPDIYASKFAIVESHILFAKWQQEQDKIAIENLVKIIEWYDEKSDVRPNYNEKIGDLTMWEWFNQFKKK